MLYPLRGSLNGFLGASSRTTNYLVSLHLAKQRHIPSEHNCLDSTTARITIAGHRQVATWSSIHTLTEHYVLVQTSTGDAAVGLQY